VRYRSGVHWSSGVTSWGPDRAAAADTVCRGRVPFTFTLNVYVYDPDPESVQ